MAQAVSKKVERVPSIDRVWIATELAKGIGAERAMVHESRIRAEAPPEPAMGVLYHEISEADERHACVIERIATRHGHVPGSAMTNGIGQALGQLKDQIVEIGRTPLDQLGRDLEAKARSVQWYIAWIFAFEAIHDSESVGELSAILADEQSHLEALQQSFNRLIAEQARGSATLKGNGKPT